MITWSLFIWFIFILGFLSTQIPKAKEILEDKQKQKRKHKFHDQIQSPDWRHLLELFNLWISLLKLFPSSHLLATMVNFPEGWVVFLAPPSHGLAAAVAPQQWWTYLLRNDECIVGSCKHYSLYIQTVFLVEVALTRTLEVKIFDFQSTLQVFHQLVVDFSWTSFITSQVTDGCWNSVLFWILFSNLRKHLQKRSAYSVCLCLFLNVLYCFTHFPVVSFRAPLLCSTFNVLNSNGILWGLALEKYLYFKSS